MGAQLHNLPLDPSAPGGPVLSGACVFKPAGGGRPAMITRPEKIVLPDVIPTGGGGPRSGWAIYDNERLVLCPRATNEVRIYSLITGALLGSWAHAAVTVDGVYPIVSDGEIWVPNRSQVEPKFQRFDIDGTLLGVVDIDPTPVGPTLGRPFTSEGWTKVPGQNLIWATLAFASPNRAAEFNSVTGVATGRIISTGSSWGPAASETHLYLGFGGTGASRLREYDLATLTEQAQAPVQRRQLPGGDTNAATVPVPSYQNGRILVKHINSGVDEWEPGLSAVRRLCHQQLENIDGFACQTGVRDQDIALLLTPNEQRAAVLWAATLQDSIENGGTNSIAIHRIDDATAEWLIPADPENARTLRTVAVPGDLGNSRGTELDHRRTRLEYRVGGNGWVAFTPGAFLDAAVPAGDELAIRATFLSPLGKAQAPDPWIGAEHLDEPSEVVVLLEDPSSVSFVPVAVDSIRGRVSTPRLRGRIG
jgi:hypothetical protein